MDEYCRAQERLPMSVFSAFGISLPYYFCTDRANHIWQVGTIVSFSPFHRRYVLQIDGQKFLFDHDEDLVAWAQFDDEEGRVVNEKVVVNWINTQTETAEISLFTYADHDTDMPAKKVEVALSTVTICTRARTG